MLQGSNVALVTPFKKGEIDYNALENLIHWHLENGTDGFVLLGTTGEATSLASDEKEALLRFAMQRINHKVPIIIGTGTNNLQNTISMTQKARELGGDYALIVTPYYVKPTQQGLYEFYKTVADKVNIPIILYNVPGRTGVNMTAATTVRIAKDCPNVVAVKEASGNIVQASEIVRDAKPGFVVLSGEDGVNMPLMAVGVKGTISVTANIIPKLMHEHIKTCLKGHFDQADKQHLDLTLLNQVMFLESNPIPVKAALYLMGKIDYEYRLPLCKMAESNLATLKTALAAYKLI
jgi:4-hydroxy-tetrahydrodipicolinate synthase